LDSDASAKKNLSSGYNEIEENLALASAQRKQAETLNRLWKQKFNIIKHSVMTKWLKPTCFVCRAAKILEFPKDFETSTE
jgi:hypothetical protein